LLFVISVNFIPYWESLHIYTHCMSWVIYLKFLSAGKFVLIEYLTLISVHIFAMLFDCFISWLYMRVLKLTLGKNIFLQNFPQASDFQCELSGHEQSSHMLTYQLPSRQLSETSEQDPYRFKTCFSFSTIHTSLHFYHVMLCVFLVDFSRDFGILCTSSHSMIFIVSSVILLSLCAFRILEYLLIGIFFLRYCAWKSFSVCVMGWSWYIYAL